MLISVDFEYSCREGQPRLVVVEKGLYPLGIKIGEGIKGGIFVTRINDNSVAGSAGLQYGDQLLEVVYQVISFESFVVGTIRDFP